MMNGLSIGKLKEIENQFGDFQIKQVMGGGNNVYLRFGYWKRIDGNKLQEVIGQSINVVEDDYYDDDCGYKFCYLLK